MTVQGEERPARDAPARLSPDRRRPMEEDLAARIADLEHVNQNLQAMVEDLERRNEWLWREIGALRIEKAKASSPGLNTHLAPHSGPLKALGRVLRLVHGIRARFGRNGP
jgi:hypothetical protein